MPHTRNGVCRLSCKGRCTDGSYKTAPLHGRPPSHPPRGSYGEYKRCRHCHVWIAWDGLRCPCCSHKLSTAPRRAMLAARERRKKKEAAAAQ